MELKFNLIFHGHKIAWDGPIYIIRETHNELVCPGLYKIWESRSTFETLKGALDYCEVHTKLDPMP